MSKRATHDFKIRNPQEMQVGTLPPLDRHPGCFIRDTLLPEYGLSVSALAERIGVNRPNLSNVLHGKADVSRELAYRLGALMNDQVADLLIAYQHAWDLDREKARRDELKGQIMRIKPREPSDA